LIFVLVILIQYSLTLCWLYYRRAKLFILDLVLETDNFTEPWSLLTCGLRLWFYVLVWFF